MTMSTQEIPPLPMSDVTADDLTNTLVWTLRQLYPIRKRLDFVGIDTTPVTDLFEELRVIITDLLECDDPQQLLVEIRKRVIEG
ncbi:MAG: hypothetical protein ACXAB4_09260, partial [Candidatus Hodarchaeales archaeon]|jgi:hypothetical protein